jgi:hypothetical protein
MSSEDSTRGVGTSRAPDLQPPETDLRDQLAQLREQLDWERLRGGGAELPGFDGNGAHPTSCPPAEEISRLAAPAASLGADTLELSATERNELLDHLETCASCRAEARIALHAGDFLANSESSQDGEHQPESGGAEIKPFPGPAVEHPDRVSPETARFSTRGWLNAAAAALLISLAGVMWLVSGNVGEDSAADRVVRSADNLPTGVLAPPDRSILERSPGSFAWPAQAGATGYRVQLYSAAAEPLWASDSTTETRLVLAPESLPATLLSAGNYLWEVEVEGRVARETLGPFWFQILGSD